MPIEDVVRCALLMDEIASMQPKLQILGVTIVVDLEGLSISHISQLTPTVASQIVTLMGVCWVISCHRQHALTKMLLHVDQAEIGRSRKRGGY